MITHTLKLDVKSNGSQAVISVRHFDTDRRLIIHLNESKDTYALEIGSVAVLAAKKPDGSILFNECNVEENTVIYDFTPQTAASEGAVECEVRIYSSDGKLITSPRFTINVCPRVTEADEEILSDTERTAFDEAMSSEIVRGANEVQRIAAEEARIVAEAEREAAVDHILDDAIEALEMALTAEEAAAEVHEAISALNSHNSDLLAHSDMRTQLAELGERIDSKAGAASTLAGYGILDAYTKSNIDDTVVPSSILRSHPIGSIYMSVYSTSPKLIFGGEWERIKDRFLLAAGDNYGAGSTGGSANHTLTQSEMPSHNHGFYDKPSNLPALLGRDGQYTSPESIDIYYGCGETIAPTSTYSVGITSVGGGQAHNNMPPYLTVYMWVRTA